MIFKSGSNRPMLSWVPLRATFLPGGVGWGRGSEPLAQKILASCPNFYETVEGKEGSYDKLTGLHTKWIYYFLSIYHEPITHVKRNIKLSLPFRRPKISMIRSIADYRVGICSLKVNKCDAVTDTLLLHGAAEVTFNLRNAPNDRSVVGVNATICTTLFGKMWKRIK